MELGQERRAQPRQRIFVHICQTRASAVAVQRNWVALRSSTPWRSDAAPALEAAKASIHEGAVRIGTRRSGDVGRPLVSEGERGQPEGKRDQPDSIG